MDKETLVLHTGLRLLAQIMPSARRRVLAYWGARAEALPLIDKNGRVIQENPVEDEPPILRFIGERDRAEDAVAS